MKNASTIKGTKATLESMGFAELLANYEKALTDYGLSYSARLHLLTRATRVVRFHENQGAEHMTDGIVASYTADLTERYNSGVMKHRCYINRIRDLTRFIDYIKTGSVAPVNPMKGSRSAINPAFTLIADEFVATIPHVNTRNDVRWVAHRYFLWLEGRGFEDLTWVGAPEIQKFLLECSKTTMPNSMYNIKLYIKKLYAFLYDTERAGTDYKDLLSFTVNRDVKVHPALPRDDVAKLLDTIDRTTAMGKRNYAIMLLGAVLGLRACDIIALKRTDIDWEKGELRIVQSKTSHMVVLPLTEDVGKALKDYIFNARHKTDEPRVFLRMCAPHTPIKAAVTLGEIYGGCCKAAGLPVSKKFHDLRRSLATAMITNGVSIYDVQQGLGDKKLESVKPYIGLDVKHLKVCALTFDGIKPSSRRSSADTRKGGARK